MRQFFFALGIAGLFTLGAQAAAVCASPAEMKALQAAVLEQQLAAAAQSCHVTEDYARFVAAYRDAIVRSDQTVRAFFQRQRAGESYSSYKARIAHDISLKSLHDPKFCATAKTVFDLALGRGRPAEPPALVETGYEGCRLLPDKPQLVAKPPQPHPVLAAAARPVAPVKIAALQPAWDADRILALLRPVDVPVPTPAPPHAVHALALAHSTALPKPAPPAAKQRSVNAQPQPPAIALHRAELPGIGVPPVPVLREPHPEVGHAAARYATVERPRWHDVDGDAEGNIPNAYLPGAQWLGAEADAPPRGRSDEVPPAMYRGPDGRWYVPIGPHDRWNDEEGD